MRWSYSRSETNFIDQSSRRLKPVSSEIDPQAFTMSRQTENPRQSYHWTWNRVLILVGAEVCHVKQWRSEKQTVLSLLAIETRT